jgi:hypothetical protein
MFAGRYTYRLAWEKLLAHLAEVGTLAAGTCPSGFEPTARGFLKAVEFGCKAVSGLASENTTLRR